MEQQRELYIMTNVICNTKDMLDRMKSISGIFKNLSEQDKEYILGKLEENKDFKKMRGEIMKIDNPF